MKPRFEYESHKGLIEKRNEAYAFLINQEYIGQPTAFIAQIEKTISNLDKEIKRRGIKTKTVDWGLLEII